MGAAVSGLRAGDIIFSANGVSGDGWFQYCKIDLRIMCIRISSHDGRMNGERWLCSVASDQGSNLLL